MNVLDSRCSVLTSLEHLSGGPRNKFQVIRGTPPDTNSKSNQISSAEHQIPNLSARYILNLIRSYNMQYIIRYYQMHGIVMY